jgi:DNA-binding response OmpR family regulator
MFSILTVDDEVDICKMIASFLKPKGYEVRISNSGEKALEMIADEKPDVILMDLNMPGMGGETTLKEIKKHYSDLPVVMVTVIDDEKKAAELLHEGASDYITKPINFNYLEKIISSLESIYK